MNGPNGEHRDVRDRCICWGNVCLEWLALGAIVSGTLALGGVGEWAFALLFGLLSAAICIWGGMRLLASDARQVQCHYGDFDYATAPPIVIHSRWLPWIALAVAGYFIFQTVPLPSGLAHMLSPRRVEREADLRTAMGEPPAAAYPLSVNNLAGREALPLIALATMAFTAGAYLAGNRRRARRMVTCLLGLGLFEALYGLAENLSGHHYIFWIPAAKHVACGTFYNRNHFAALLSLLAPLSIGWFYFRAAARQADVESAALVPPTFWDILSSRAGLWMLVPAALMLGVIQSASRGGFAGLLFGTALFFALSARGRSIRVVSWLTLMLSLTLFAYAISSDYQIMLDRFGQLAERGEGRLEVWRDSLGIIRDYPLFGVGLGNFPTIFMLYSTRDTFSYPFQAHNEWLEGLITLGFVGMALLAALIVTLLILSYQRLRKTGQDQCWLLGAWCGLVGLAVHSFVEFNLHIPSITVVVFFLAGILVGFNHHGSTSRIDRVLREDTETPAEKMARQDSLT